MWEIIHVNIPCAAVTSLQDFPGSPMANGSFPITGKKLSSWKYPTGCIDKVEMIRSAANWPTLPTETAGWITRI